MEDFKNLFWWINSYLIWLQDWLTNKQILTLHWLTNEQYRPSYLIKIQIQMQSNSSYHDRNQIISWHQVKIGFQNQLVTEGLVQNLGLSLEQCSKVVVHYLNIIKNASRFLASLTGLGFFLNPKSILFHLNFDLFQSLFSSDLTMFLLETGLYYILFRDIYYFTTTRKQFNI